MKGIVKKTLMLEFNEKEANSLLSILGSYDRPNWKKFRDELVELIIDKLEMKLDG